MASMLSCDILHELTSLGVTLADTGDNKTERCDEMGSNMIWVKRLVIMVYFVMHSLGYDLIVL